jgi:hypothetical protein
VELKGCSACREERARAIDALEIAADEASDRWQVARSILDTTMTGSERVDAYHTLRRALTALSWHKMLATTKCHHEREAL